MGTFMVRKTGKMKRGHRRGWINEEGIVNRC